MAGRSLYDELVAMLGSENVSADDFERICYSRDAGSLLPKMPAYIVVPREKNQIIDLFHLANREKVPLVLRGAGSSMCGAPIPLDSSSIMLDLTRMRRILALSEESMSVLVEGGITWTEVIMYLKERGWALGLEGPWSAPSATVGGSIAVAAICMGAARYGGLGSQILGMEVVLPDGQLIKTGSGANPANPMIARDCNGIDLAGLFIGSHGTLGAITEVSLRIYPLHEAEQCFAFSFPTLEDGIKGLHGLAKHRIAFDSRMFVYPIPEEIGGGAGLVYMLRGRKAEVEDFGQLSLEIMNASRGQEIPGFGETYYRGRFTTRAEAFGKAGPGWLEVAGFIPIPRYPQIAAEIIKFFESRKREMTQLEIKWSLGGLLETNSVNIPVALFCNESRGKAWETMRGYLGNLSELMFGMGVSPYWIGHLSPYLRGKLGHFYELYRKIKTCVDPGEMLNPKLL